MAGLEAVLRIGATDSTAPVLAEIKKKIADLEKTTGTMSKFTDSVAAVTKATDPLASSIISTQKALATQRSEIASVIGMLDRVVGPTERAAGAQRALARSVEVATDAFARQGAAARRAAEHVNSAARGGGGHGGHGGLASVVPFAGPAIEHGAEKYFETGASVEEEIARLKALGASQGDIDKARGDWRNLSSSYAGVTENDYLEGYRSARVVAPGEAFEMAERGARYRLALRNSGISSSPYDVENIMKIMDEQGLKTPAERDSFINETLKTQQTFGSQISTETMLSAYRNAKQAIYDWSPKFKNSYFPTILQAAGQQGGTEIMTAFNNWVGGHMTHAELKSMAAAGFVNNRDLMYNKTGDVKGIRPGAHMWNAGEFKSNIADWSWDFHDHFMKRKGATESKFDDLVATLPRNMAALVSFLVHNEDRIKRDAETREHAVGAAAASNDFLSKNPVAGLEALTESLSAFVGVVSEPAMKAVGANLEAMAAGMQKLAKVYGDFAHDNPKMAEALGIGAGAGTAAAGGYLSFKLLTGAARLFGLGGGAAAEAAGGAAAAEGGGLLAALGGPVGWMLAGGAALAAGGYYIGHNAVPPRPSDFPTDADFERSRRSRLVYHPGGWVDDPEAAHGRALSRLIEGGHAAQQVNVHGEATVRVPVSVTVTASSQLLSIVQRAEDAVRDSTIALNPLATGHPGRMDSDAAPYHGGIGSR